MSKVNSLSCSRNKSEMILLCDMVHYPAGSSIRRSLHCSHKGMDMVSNNTQVGCGGLNNSQLVLKGLKVCQENVLHTITPPPRA